MGGGEGPVRARLCSALLGGTPAAARRMELGALPAALALRAGWAGGFLGRGSWARGRLLVQTPSVTPR